MTRKKTCSLTAAFALCAAAIVTLYCTQVEFDNTFDDDGKFTVTVKGGTGSGSFAPNDPVEISANVPDGFQFVNWAATPEVMFAYGNAHSEKTTFIMIDAAVTVTANLKPAEAQQTKYLVMVEGGITDNSVYEYAKDTTVNITADQPTQGEKFSHWTSSPAVTFADSGAASTTFTMIDKKVTIKAHFEKIPDDHNNVTVNKEGSGTANSNPNSAKPGTTITITANPATGWTFVKWEIESGGIALVNIAKDTTTFTMPERDVTVKAIFEQIKHKVTVVSGGSGSSGSGDYPEGDRVNINAGTPIGDGLVFSHWETDDGVTFDNDSSAATRFTMINKEVTVTAVFTDMPDNHKLIMVKWNDDKCGKCNASADKASASPGDMVSLTATPDDGWKLKQWTVVVGGVELIDGEGVGSNKFIMGNNPVTVNAEFELIKYNIKYNLNGGTDGKSNLETYTIETLPITLNNPTRDGHTFGGWYANVGLTERAVTSIPVGSTGNKEYWAKWVESNTSTDCKGWGDWDTTAVATCEAAGSRKRTCIENTTVSETASIPQLTEDDEKCNTSPTGCQAWGEWEVTTDATCEAEGEATKRCTTQGTVSTADSTRTISMLTGAECESHGLCGTFENGTTILHHRIDKPQFCDPRDGKRYVYVEIDQQVWMAENLNYDTADGTGSWCYGNEPANCAIYGRLYNWNTAKVACPEGWHLPDAAEWDGLMRTVDGHFYGDGNYWTLSGDQLKSQTGWSDNGHGGSDTYGFSALPGGNRSSEGTFQGVIQRGSWWSATEYGNENAGQSTMSYSDGNVYQYSSNKANAFSVRCVKD